MVLGGKTYFAANVTSVGTFVQKPNRLLEIFIGLVGFSTLFNNFLYGVLFLGLDVLLWYLRKPSFTIRLGSSSGEADALTLKDGVLVNRIVAAINEAIIFRG